MTDKVTAAAFETLAISNNTEQFIIAALRADKRLYSTPDPRVETIVAGSAQPGY